MAGLAAGANGKSAWRAPLAIVILLVLVGITATAAGLPRRNGRPPASPSHSCPPGRRHRRRRSREEPLCVEVDLPQTICNHVDDPWEHEEEEGSAAAGAAVPGALPLASLRRPRLARARVRRRGGPRSLSPEVRDLARR